MIPITTTPVGLPELSPFVTHTDLDSRTTLAAIFQSRFNLRNTLFVSSGRTALALALRRIGNPGARICFPAYTCPVIFEAILSAGMLPVPVDVEYETMSLGTNLVGESKKGISGVIAVHLFGDPVSIRQTRDMVGGKPTLIEDCAQSLGARTDSSPAGSQGDFSVFSFGIGKTITAGIGGALASRLDGQIESEMSPRLCDSSSALFKLLSMWAGRNPTAYSIVFPLLRSLRSRADEEEVKRISLSRPEKFLSARLPDVACRVLVSQVQKLDKTIEVRREHSRMLTEILRDHGVDFSLSQQATDGTSTFTRYVIRIPTTRGFSTRKALIKGGYECELPYQNLSRILPSFGEFPNAKRLLLESLAVPIHGGLAENQLHDIGRIISRSR